MTHLAFGQPLGAIMQYAYTVEDISSAIERFRERLGVGPWFVRGPLTSDRARYRGQPTDMCVTLARGFTGQTMVELIQQHNDVPSVYTETIARQGYGFHHWAIMVMDIDAAVAGAARRGHEVAFSDEMPTGSSVRYVDATRDLPGMIEYVGYTETQERLYGGFYAASVAWDGSDPVRSG
jgi:hypothetical protein